MSQRPDRTEAAEYYFTYIDKTPDEDIRVTLHRQLPAVLSLFRQVSEEQSRHRYAPEKWSLREVLSHINDTERVFSFRAFWFARDLPEPLPSFDQNLAMDGTSADLRAWASHVQEFERIRGATLALFDALGDEAWLRRGTASGNPVTVRALAHITAGHVEHHVELIRERYLQGGG